MKRGGPLKRKTRLRSASELRTKSTLRRSSIKRKRTKRPAHLVDREYSEWIHGQPCCVPGCTSRRMEQHHKREGVAGSAKSHDHDSISLCADHHVPGIHALAGFFKGWVRQQVRDFVNGWIETLRARYLAQQSSEPRCDVAEGAAF